MTVIAKAAVLVVLVCSLLGFRAYLERAGGVAAVAAPPAMLDTAAIAHTDHTPRHGGLVLMNGDTHFEVMVAPDGTCRVYFTDAVRVELPPEYASRVTVGLANQESRREVGLQMDPNQNVWIGQLGRLDDPNSVVRITYESKGARPYWIDVPLEAVTTP